MELFTSLVSYQDLISSPLNSQQETTSRPRALPPQRFQALLTLFSKSFSSFPHGTCSLSVSYPYLALGGVYHPLRAAFPGSPTQKPNNDDRYSILGSLGLLHRALTFCGTPFQGIYIQEGTSVMLDHETTIRDIIRDIQI